MTDTPKMKLVQTFPQAEALYDDLINVMKKHGEKVPPMTVLAILCTVVGKLIALQDQRTITNEAVMECVARNIELGNQEMIADLANSVKGNA